MHPLKKLPAYLIVVLVFFQTGCYIEMPTEPGEPETSLIDTNIHVPTFTSTTYSLSNAKCLNLVTYNMEPRVFYSTQAANNIIFTSTLADISDPDTLSIETGEITSMYCQHARQDVRIMIGYSCLASPTEDQIKLGTYVGGFFSQNISMGPHHSTVHIFEYTEDHWQVMHGSISVPLEQKIYRKLVEYMSVGWIDEEPNFNGTNNSYLYYNLSEDGFMPQSYRISAIPGGSSVAVMAAVENNRYIMGPASFVTDILNSSWQGNSPSYDIAPLGGANLCVYESQMDPTTPYNESSIANYPQHIRLSLRKFLYDYEVHTTGPYVESEMEVEAENSVLIPVPVNLSDDVSHIACVSDFNQTETSIAYLRNGHLYYTVAQYIDKHIRIGEIRDLGAIPYDANTHLGICRSNIDYISVYDGSNLTIFSGN